MANPLLSWEKKHIATYSDLMAMKKDFENDSPKICGGDTETDGLHIKLNKAFLMVFGWIKRDNISGIRGRVYTMYPTPENMKVVYELANTCDYFFFWNTKFDLHMLRNAGVEYPHTNVAEGMALARLTLEAKPARDGGDSLKLKDIAVRYVYSKANEHEEIIKDELKKLKKQWINILAAALKQFPMQGTFTASGKQKFWGKGAIEDFLKDPTHDVEDLPEDVRQVWIDWNEDYPEPTYEDIDRDLMIEYAANDVVIMLEFVRKAFPVLMFKKQVQVFKDENDTILPLYRMEQVGLKVDREYLESSRLKVKSYIKKLREEMYALIGQKINVGQHKEIIKKFNDKWGIVLDSADKDAMKKVLSSTTGEPARYAKLITLLRTYEKWYSTYIVRILNISKQDGRAYTQIHQCSAVSGRVGSDFQQFPKKALKDEEGNVLYHPRQPFITTGNGYDKVYYFDYSQIELRVQALYTLKVSGGDMNLCRAYMPFKCIHGTTGEIFDPFNLEHLEQWNNGLWLDENKQPWKPTDVHGATTMQAFPHLVVGSDEFAEMRSKGKIVNFLKNYGGSIAAIVSQIDNIDFETAKALDEGYYAAFPDVKIYQELVVSQAIKNGFVVNLFGRRYYLVNSRDFYKLGNYLIQGSSADFLKKKIRQVDALLLGKMSRFQMNIHDELSFEIFTGEEYLLPMIKKIMEDAPWSNVPIVVDVEVTETTWAEKKDFKLEEAC